MRSFYTLRNSHNEHSVFLPLSLPQTAFTRLYNILHQNPESLENTRFSLRAFTAFYTCLRIQILSSAPRKARENIAFSLAFSLISSCFAKKSSILAFQKMPLPLSLPQLDFLPLKTAERSSTGRLTSGASFYAFFSFS